MTPSRCRCVGADVVAGAWRGCGCARRRGGERWRGCGCCGADAVAGVVSGCGVVCRAVGCCRRSHCGKLVSEGRVKLTTGKLVSEGRSL